MTDDSLRRLVFIHPSDELYGADRVLLDIFEALTPAERSRAQFWLPTDLRHSEHPLCAELERRGARVQHHDLPILRRSYRTPAHMLALLRRFFLLCRALRRARPEIVYCTTSAAFLGGPASRLAGVPHVIGHVQELWSPSDTKVLGNLARAFKQILAISENVARNLPAHVRSKVAVVHNATPFPETFEPLEDHTGPLTYIVASRWNGWKGHRTLLAAWNQAGCPGRLIVLGGKPAAGDTTDVAELVSGLSDPGSVDIVGEVSDVAPYLNAADVMVVPSDDPEPFGLVAIEAFARGRPVIGSAGGGLLEIVSDHHDGWLYPLRDVALLARLIGSLDRAAVTAAGRRARSSYCERFTPTRYVDEWREAVGLGHGKVASDASADTVSARPSLTGCP